MLRRVTMVPLIKRPITMDKKDFIVFNLSIIDIRTAVHAPVTGRGNPTKKIKPT